MAHGRNVRQGGGALGRWCYFYRASDTDGNLMETMLSPRRDMDAAKVFFSCALETAGHVPETVITDTHGSYPRTIRETPGPTVCHRMGHYLNNVIEQDHRGIKQRSYPMRWFGSFASAARFCTAYDDRRDYVRPRTHVNKAVSLATQKRLLQERWREVCTLLEAVSPMARVASPCPSSPTVLLRSEI